MTSGTVFSHKQTFSVAHLFFWTEACIFLRETFANLPRQLTGALRMLCIRKRKRLRKLPISVRECMRIHAQDCGKWFALLSPSNIIAYLNFREREKRGSSREKKGKTDFRLLSFASIFAAKNTPLSAKMAYFLQGRRCVVRRDIFA